MFPEYAEVLADDQDRERWLRARRELMTASDIGAVLVPRDLSYLEPEAFDAASPWSAALEVYAQKIGAMEGHPDTEWQMWGRRQEPHVADAWARDSTRTCPRCLRTWAWTGSLPAEWELLDGISVRRFRTRRGPRAGVSLTCGQCDRALRPRRVDRCGLLLRSREWPWLGATPDYVGTRPDRPGQPGVVQCKIDRWGWPDGVPSYIQVQVQTEMMVTGCTWGSVAVLVGGCEFQWRDFDADPALQDAIQRGALRFMDDHVHRQEPPPPTGPPESVKRALAALYPRQVPRTRLFLTGQEWVAKAKERRDALAEAKRLEGVAELLSIEFKAAAGDHEVVSLDDGTYFTCKRQRIPERTLSATEFRALRYWED